jgi:hypothetical protein
MNLGASVGGAPDLPGRVELVGRRTRMVADRVRQRARARQYAATPFESSIS